MQEFDCADSEDLGKNRILVAVGSSPNSAHLIRWAHRSAEALGSSWLVVHIDSGKTLGDADNERLEANLALARKSGAETSVVQASDVAKAVVEEARNRGATMIVIGRSGLSRLGPFPKKATVSDRIVREAGDIDVVVIQDALAPRRDVTLAEVKRLFESSPRQYLLLAGSFAVISGLGWLIEPVIGYRSVTLVFLAVILCLSFLAKPAPVAVFAVLSAFVLDFFFISPQYKLSISTSEDLILFTMYFVVAFATGTLVARLRAKERKLIERESMSTFLFTSIQRLTECRTLEEAVSEATEIMRGHYGGTAAISTLTENAEVAGMAGGAGRFRDDADTRAARLAFVEGVVCGKATDRVPEAGMRHFPVMMGGSVALVLSVEPPAGPRWTRNDDSLIFALGRTLALIVERERSEARRRKTALELESDRLSKVLLDSVSHELRTPLTTITGSISALKDENLAGNRESRDLLVEGALNAADRLNRLVEDILSMSRIESTGLKLNRSLVDISDLANESLEAAGPELDGKRVVLELPAECRPVRLDLGLAARLAANVLRNAARYSPPDSPIEFGIGESATDLVLTVRDHGPGVAESELESIFERFNRGKKATGGGLGLGLAICKGIVAAHGGGIGARNRPEGGLEVKAVFPSCVEEAGQ